MEDIDRSGKTVIASTVFIDIVGYSRSAIGRQIAMKSALNRIVASALARIPESERIILDTGDGAALCFLGDPEDALFVATAINDGVRREDGAGAQRLRIGIHLGPIKVVLDLNGRPNVLGDGINFAQRIMSFAEQDEMLVSRAYFEVVARLGDGNDRFFRYLGVKHDKHVHEHQIYAVDSDLRQDGGRWFVAETGRADRPEPDPVPAQPPGSGASEFDPHSAEAPLETAIDALTLARETERLATLIGPVADIVVKRAVGSAATVGDFYATLAGAIPDTGDRDAFLAGSLLGIETAPHDAVARIGAGAGGAGAGGAGAGAPSPSNPARHDAETDPAPPAVRPPEPEDLARLERLLAEHIGPLARTLVRREAEGAADYDALVARLAGFVREEARRAKFTAAAERRG
ncbi:MAG: hypothetical protein RID91_03755 [Azospirillaceae bacterium]